MLRRRQLYLSSAAMELLLRNFLATGLHDPQEELLLSQLLQHSLALYHSPQRLLHQQQAPSSCGSSPRQGPASPRSNMATEQHLQQLLSSLLQLAAALANPDQQQQKEQQRQQREMCSVEDSPRVADAMSAGSFASVPAWQEDGAQEGGKLGRGKLVQMALQALLSLKVRKALRMVVRDLYTRISMCVQHVHSAVTLPQADC